MSEDFSYIVAIAHYGSISKAARAVHISQPGLSQRLKRLEAQLGTELFDRESMPIRPTASGEVYLKYAQRALAAEESMRRDVYSIAHRRRQSLRIGVSMTRANTLLSDVVTSFYESHRGCTLEFREMSSLEQLHELFLSDSVDFAVFTPIAPDPSMYELQALCRERLVLIAASSLNPPQLARARRRSRVSLRELEGMPFILPACGAYFDPLINRMIESTGARLDIVVRDCSTDLALRLVKSGLGVSIVPSTSLISCTGLQCYDLEDFEAGNELRYVRRRDKDVSAEEQLFVEILKGWMGDAAQNGLW